MSIQYQSNSDPYKTALAYHQQKEYAQAKSLYLKVLQQQPQKAEAWVNLASVCDALGEGEDALTYAEKALKLNPRVRDGYFNKGAILRRLQRWEEAIKAFQLSLGYFPQDHDAYYYLGQCYFNVGLFDLALDAYKKASDIQPTLASIYAAGLCYQNTNRLAVAVICFNECIKIKPTDKSIRVRLLSCYQQLNDYPKLNEMLSSLLPLKGFTLEEQQELLFAKQCLSIWSEEPDLEKGIIQAIEESIKAGSILSVNPWRALALPLSLSTRLLLAQKHAASIENKYRQQTDWTVEVKAQPGRLRIGYLSVDFRVHAVGFLVQSLFALHDRSRFEVYAYSYGANDQSQVRKTIEQGVDHFIDIRNDSVFAAAAKIAADSIDILIDLTGFTADNRFAILALRPAPIQANYLGYCLSTGSQAIDYFLADKTMIQEEEKPYYSEKIVYLPHISMVLNHREAIHAELAGTRATWQLPQNAFVYGCFNQNYKIELAVFELWMEILQAVENSVLWLFSPHEIVSANLRREALKRSIDPQRLIFAPFANHAEYLARHQHMDLFLDTLQHNAVTTACDAVYAGVPILTLAGNHALSRGAKSIMEAAGPSELTQRFIATNKKDYVQKAIDFGLHPDEFAILKKAFQAQLSQSSLLDVPARVKAIETAYERMWSLYQQGLEPQSFTVEDTY